MIAFIIEIDSVLCKVRANACKYFDDLIIKIKAVLCEVSDGAEERVRLKNNILVRLYSLCGTNRVQRNS